MTLRVLWENFGNKDPALAKEWILNVTPKRVVVNINDYKQADTFHAEVEYKNFPFDPRLIKAMGVTIHIQNMKELYKDGNLGVPNQIIPSTKNTIFQGFADEDSVDLNDSSRSVNFEGRDFTALFLDTPYPFGTVELDATLDQVIKKILTQRKDTEKMTLDNRTGEATFPAMKQFFPDFGGLSGKKNVKHGENYWEVVQDIVGRAGLIAFVELDKLVIAKPRNLYSSAQKYQMVYGINVKNLKFTRKLAKQKGFNVRVRSLSPETKEVISVDIPRQAELSWASSIGVPLENVKIKKPTAPGAGKDGESFQETEAPFLAFNVPNIKSEDQLKKIGQGIYEELGRQQIEGSFETKEMASRQENPANPTGAPVEVDFTKIRNASPILIGLAQDDLEQLEAIKGGLAAKQQFLERRGYDPSVAQALAKSMGKFSLTFYTRDAEFTLDKDQGFSLKVNFINFIDIKNKGLV